MLKIEIQIFIAYNDRGQIKLAKYKFEFPLL